MDCIALGAMAMVCNDVALLDAFYFGWYLAMRGCSDVCTMALWVFCRISDDGWISVSHCCEMMSWLDVLPMKGSARHGGYGAMVDG